jgi:hypothetical protein
MRTACAGPDERSSTPCGNGARAALIACVAIFAENVQGTLPGVVGLVLAADCSPRPRRYWRSRRSSC